MSKEDDKIIPFDTIQEIWEKTNQDEVVFSDIHDMIDYVHQQVCKEEEMHEELHSYIYYYLEHQDTTQNDDLKLVDICDFCKEEES